MVLTTLIEITTMGWRWRQ